MWPDAGEPPAEPGTWEDLADELLEGMDLHGLTDVVAVGHSFGSVALLLAAVRGRARFRGLCLLDPTIPPPELLRRLHRTSDHRRAFDQPIADRARRRRAEFQNAEEAFAYWRQKRLFADWSDDALWLYTHHMLQPMEGGGFTLSWSPAWEGHYYESLYTGTWEDIEQLDPTLPVLVIGGGTSDTFLPDAAEVLRTELPHARIEVVEGFGHLFPLAAPEATRHLLEDWLGEVVPDRVSES
jgi:pimeloyl-ACP methyl ester carboxylesterase